MNQSNTISILYYMRILNKSIINSSSYSFYIIGPKIDLIYGMFFLSFIKLINSSDLKNSHQMFLSDWIIAYLKLNPFFHKYVYS